MRKIGSVPILFLLVGCASLDKNECLHADWYAIGLEDGARGRALERLGDHRRACAKHSVTPEAERYMSGRSEGLKSFCTYERGYAEGRGGNAYSAACPQPQAQIFMARYNRGRELHDMHRQLEQHARAGSRAAGSADARGRAARAAC